MKLVTKSNVPAGFTANPKGFDMPATGDPATAVSIPVAAFRLKTETVLSFWFPRNTKPAMGATATPVGLDPVPNGEPGAGVSIPVFVLTENTERELAFWLLTKRTLCIESKAINSAPAPAVNGEPATGVSVPDALTANTETVPEPELEMNARLAGA